MPPRQRSPAGHASNVMRKMEIMKKFVPRLLCIGLLFTFTLAGRFDVAVGASSNAPYSSQWRISGPSGGDVRSLVVDPNDPDRFYFGTLDGQMYTSSDGARTWHLLANFNRPRLFVDHIIVDPRNSKVLYVATHRHKESGGFFKSSDGGLTWRESPELRNEALHSLAQSERDPNILITGTFNGIFRSTDSGETWTPLSTASTPGLVHVESLAIDPHDTNIIYAGTWYLPYKTTDGGKTWRIIKNGIIDDSDILRFRESHHNLVALAQFCSILLFRVWFSREQRKVSGGRARAAITIPGW